MQRETSITPDILFTSFFNPRGEYMSMKIYNHFKYYTRTRLPSQYGCAKIVNPSCCTGIIELLYLGSAIYARLTYISTYVPTGQL